MFREEIMARINRRRFLQSTGGGLAGILASGRAPAFAQGTTVHWLRLGDFVPASDTLLRRELLPETWESYRAAGKLLKAKGRPIGQTLGHAYNDAPAFTYPYLWSFGGKEVEADGKTVALNSKETLDSVKFMVAFWKDAHDESGLAWDDSNNNRAFLGGTISSTSNAASIYIEALRKPEQYL